VATTTRSPVATLLSTAAVLAAAALTLTPAAAAHGGGGALGFRSTVTQITPVVVGVSATVLDYDDRLQLRNTSDKPIVILGYQGEPYLAFRNGRVYRNTHSPATYLNDDRFGQVKLPKEASPTAQPAWEQVSPREEYDWHDHRIHWMSRTLPPKVQAASDKPQHIFNWTVPGRVGGTPLRIAGSLDYQPPPGGSFPKVLIIPLVLVVVGGIAAVWLRTRRARGE
jgi:hypothetical protein